MSFIVLLCEIEHTKTLNSKLMKIQHKPQENNNEKLNINIFMAQKTKKLFRRK